MSIRIYGIRNHITGKVTETRLFFIIFFIVGIIGIATEATRNLFISITPLALLLSLAAIIIFHQPVNLKKEIIIFASIYLAGFLVEAAGVNTGVVFGSYSYGDGLGVKVYNTPLMIGINWVILVYCTSVMTERLLTPAIVKILISSSVMILYDLILEQVAPVMDMWSFEGGTAPARNYLVWFILAIIFHAILKLGKVKITNRQAPFILYIQALFFIILTIILKLSR